MASVGQLQAGIQGSASQTQQQQQAGPQSAEGGSAGGGGGGGAGYSTTSLYVGDLDEAVSEAQLYEVFSQVGQIVSIRVCRDLITRRSLGYAYVNFNTAHDASRALELLNFTAIGGRSVRIMFSHRDPSLRKSGTANIFIKNLDRAIDHKALHDTFSAFGAILSCKVAMDPAGQSKGYGFVQFDSEESAQAAIERVNGMLLNDKQVYVGPFIRRQERGSGGAGQAFSNVYVKHLGDEATDESLRAAFAEYGTIASAVVMKDAAGKSKGFGFVNFEREEDAARAVEALNGRKEGDRVWYVGRAQKKSEREAELRQKFEAEQKEKMEKYQGVNLYLKNLDDSVDEEKLRELFSEFGAITSCKIMKDPSGQSKGAGFVALSSPEEASRAVTEMNGKMVGAKPIYVALAQRREDRRARLQAQFNQRGGEGGRGGAGMSAGAAAVPASMPLFIPGAPGLAAAQQMFYGQPGAPGLIPAQAGYAYQQQMMGAMRPGMGGQMPPNFFVPFVAQPRHGAASAHYAGGGMGNHRGGGGGRRGGGYHHQAMQQQQQQSHPHQRSPQQPQQQQTPIGEAGPPPGLSTAPAGPLPISALASALASASPEQRRAMLGEQLYPLVEQMEHDHAGKVTGMLLEMDQTEVLHLLESPDALRTKVNEAMDVLRMASGGGATGGGAAPDGAVDQLSSLTLNDAS